MTFSTFSPSSDVKMLEEVTLLPDNFATWGAPWGQLRVMGVGRPYGCTDGVDIHK